MRNLNQHNITDAVLASFANTPDPRLKEIISSLIKHLHNFARDVKLTEEEWFQGIQYLTATGHKCTGTRQEFILLSDVLGLSMLTIAMNQDKPAGCTEATVFGMSPMVPRVPLAGLKVASWGWKASPFPTPPSTSGKPTTMVYMMCNTRTWVTRKRVAS